MHSSTISRELKRNRGGRGYRPRQAQTKAAARQLKHVHLRILPQTWMLVESQLRQDWSPEQVSGWLALEKQPTVSHQRIEQELQARFYFPHPFAVWERGTNENTNGLIRQYFPKGGDFSQLTETDIQRAMARLNNRPPRPHRINRRRLPCLVAR